MSQILEFVAQQRETAKTFASQVRRKRLILAVATFFAMVMLPTLTAGYYFSFHAAPQYSTEYNFAVRGRQDLAGSPDSLGISVGAASALASFAESFIVADYMESLELVDHLNERIDFVSVFGKASSDPMHNFDEEPTLENMRDFWEWMMDVQFDVSRGIVRAQVWSFSREDSLLVAQTVLQLTEELVEEISRTAREESLEFADLQVAQAAEQLRQTRIAIEDFRLRENVIDPTEDVRRIYTQIDQIEAEILQLQSELTAVLAAQGSRSSRGQQLRQQIEAAKLNLTEVEGRIDDRLPKLSREYEQLQTDFEIARQTYSASLEARHNAEAIATQRQVYLSVYDSPRLAQESTYPDIVTVIMIVFGIAIGIWGVTYIIVLNLRDAMM